MTDWLLVPLLSVAAVLSCFRFVGCVRPDSRPATGLRPHDNG
jgi:hypothetical protein